MPKLGKSMQEWTIILEQVAHGNRQIGRGEAPRVESRPWQLYLRVQRCRYRGQPAVCRPEQIFWGPQRGEIAQCECGFHTVSLPVRVEDAGAPTASQQLEQQEAGSQPHSNMQQPLKKNELLQQPTEQAIHSSIQKGRQGEATPSDVQHTPLPQSDIELTPPPQSDQEQPAAQGEVLQEAGQDESTPLIQPDALHLPIQSTAPAVLSQPTAFSIQTPSQNKPPIASVQPAVQEPGPSTAQQEPGPSIAQLHLTKDLITKVLGATIAAVELNPQVATALIQASTALSSAEISKFHQKIQNEPVLPQFKQYQHVSISRLKSVQVGWIKKPGMLALFVWAPPGGRCIACKSTNIRDFQKGKTKLCYAVPWPYTLQTMQKFCSDCGKYFVTSEQSFIDQLPAALQRSVFWLVVGKSNACDLSLIRQMREINILQCYRLTESQLWQQYFQQSAQFDGEWTKYENYCRLLGKVPPVKPQFPVFPTHFLPQRQVLVKMFLQDYRINKVALLRELKAQTTFHAVSIDHQRQVVKRVRSKQRGVGAQVLSIMGDHNVCLSFAVVPDTSTEYVRPALQEVLSRNQEQKPKILFVDCNCCNGVIGGRRNTECGLYVQLDGMHLIMRIGRSIKAKHIRRQQFLKDIAAAIYQENEEDKQQLNTAIMAAKQRKLGKPITRVERAQHVRTTIGSGYETAMRVLSVVKAHARLDKDATQARQRSGMPVTDLSPAAEAYPVITKKVLHAVNNALVHLLNGCCSDISESHVLIGEKNFYNSGIKLPIYRSLRGTSKNEAFHSVMARAFTASVGIGRAYYDARAMWIVLRYNRARCKDLHKIVPYPSLTPRELLLFGPMSGGQDFPDWEIAEDKELPIVAFDYLDHVTTTIAQPLALDEVVITDKEIEQIEQIFDEFTEDVGCATISDRLDQICELHGSDDDSDASNDDSRTVDQIILEQEQQVGGAGTSQSLQTVRSDNQYGYPEEELMDLVEPNARQSRDVAQKRVLQRTPHTVIPNYNSQMEGIWIRIVSTQPKGGSVFTLAKRCLAEYAKERNSQLQNAVQAGPHSTAPPLWDVDIQGAYQWVKEYLQLARRPAFEGSYSAASKETQQVLQSVLKTTTPTALWIRQQPVAQQPPPTSLAHSSAVTTQQMPRPVQTGVATIVQRPPIVSSTALQLPQPMQTADVGTMVRRPPITSSTAVQLLPSVQTDDVATMLRRPPIASSTAVQLPRPVQTGDVATMMRRPPTIQSAVATNVAPHPLNQPVAVVTIEPSRTASIRTATDSTMVHDVPTTFAPIEATLPTSTSTRVHVLGKKVPRPPYNLTMQEFQERVAKAERTIATLPNPLPKLPGARRCQFCQQGWAASYNGQSHHYMHRGGMHFCPFVDDTAVYKQYQRETKTARKQWEKQYRKRVREECNAEAAVTEQDDNVRAQGGSRSPAEEP